MTHPARRIRVKTKQNNKLAENNSSSFRFIIFFLNFAVHQQNEENTLNKNISYDDN